MDTEKSKHKTAKEQTAAEVGSASATVHNIMGHGAEVYGQAEQAVGEVYDKTTRKASESYAQVKGYSYDNPGKAILIALGIGFGVGLFLGASVRRSRTA